MRIWKRRRRGEVSCHEVMERLYEYIDGELDSPERVEQIRAHLEACRKCYPQFQFEKAFLRFLAEQRAGPAPPELRRKVFERILREESSGEG